MNTINKIVKGLLLAILIIAIISVIYLVVIHNPGQDYTEFYIIDSHNNTTDYPTNITRHSTNDIVIGVINHEHEETNYTVKITKNNYTLYTFNRTLQDQDRIELPYKFYCTDSVGMNKTLNLELYKGNITNPYRTLHLRYNVI